MQYFNIQVASQLSGVASATIRAWEKRYNAVIPERAENKHRLYSETDIEKLALLYRLTEFGQSIGKIAHLELKELKNVYSTLLHRPYDEKELVTPHHDKIDCPKILGNMLLALGSFKIDIISHELDKARSLLSAKEFCLDLVDPLFKEITKRRERNEITVAQEQTVHSIVTFQIGSLINQHYQKALQQEGTLLLVGSDKNENDLLCFALLCIHYGMRFIYLSNHVSAEALVEATQSIHPTAIILAHKKTQNEDSFQHYLNHLSLNLVGKTQLYIAGDLDSGLSMELEKKKITHFPTLHALDHFLEKF